MTRDETSLFDNLGKRMEVICSKPVKLTFYSLIFVKSGVVAMYCAQPGDI